MNIAELKLDIITKIITANDHSLLLEIKNLLKKENYTESKDNSSSLNEAAIKYENTRVFSAEEQRKINLAIQQYENGECISDEEAQKEIQEWLEY